MPDNVRRRRPLAWSALLRKGHAHTASKSAGRRARRATLDSEVDEFLEERNAPGGRGLVPPGEATD
ncbi:MAG: hypothetical protein AAF458_14325 [Pseudomonadota bacterium]